MAAATLPTQAVEPTVLAGLARALVQHQILRPDEAMVLQKKADTAGVKFIDELVVSGSVSARQLARFAAETFGHPMLDITAVDLAVIPEDLIDRKLAAETRVIALGKRGTRISVAISDPTDLQTLDRIKFQTQCTVDPVVIEHDKLLKIVERQEKTASQQLSELVDEGLEVDLGGVEPTATAVDSSADVDDAPVVRFLQKILMDAINAGASDLHFEPYEKFYRIRLRIDGELREFAQPPLAIKEKLASRIKVISRLDISEKRIPQDGRMKLAISPSRAIDFRVSTLPTLFGEKIVMRILDPSSAKLGIEALGYDADQKQLLLDAVTRPYGMVLVTGPTGSGKTVSL
nr:Flp pilus assembly complex ATPase component TadA [Burkholderiaceae bacterium]